MWWTVKCNGAVYAYYNDRQMAERAAQRVNAEVNAPIYYVEEVEA